MKKISKTQDDKLGGGTLAAKTTLHTRLLRTYRSNQLTRAPAIATQPDLVLAMKKLRVDEAKAQKINFKNNHDVPQLICTHYKNNSALRQSSPTVKLKLSCRKEYSYRVYKRGMPEA